MYKKSLSGLSLVLIFTFSALYACESTTPVTQQKPVVPGKSQEQTGAVKQDSTVVTSTTNIQSGNSNSGTAGTTQNTQTAEKNGILQGQSSDANPLPAPASTSILTITSASPLSTTGSVSPTASPTSVSSSVTGSSGQLNVIINPSTPVPRPTP